MKTIIGDSPIHDKIIKEYRKVHDRGNYVNFNLQL